MVNFISYLCYTDQIPVPPTTKNLLPIFVHHVATLALTNLSWQRSQGSTLCQNSRWPTTRFNHTPRTLCLRNLILGHESGRVFAAGAGLDSPSRKEANCFFLRFNQSDDTRRWFDCVGMVFIQCGSSELQLGALRDVVALERKPGGTIAESLAGRRSKRKSIVACSIGGVSIRFPEGGGPLDRRRARAVLNP